MNNKENALKQLQLIENTLKTVRKNPKGPLTGLFFSGLVWLCISIGTLLFNKYNQNNIFFLGMGVILVLTLVSMGIFLGAQKKYRQSPISEIDIIAKHIFLPLSFSPIILFLIYFKGATSFGTQFNTYIINIAMIYGTCLFATYCIYKEKPIVLSSLLAFLSPVFYKIQGEFSFLPTLILSISGFIAFYALYKLEKSTINS